MQPEAWTTAGTILSAQNAPAETQLFAAQTFRSKITYDFNDLAIENRMTLRDSLLGALRLHASGTRVLVRQIGLALADLVLQLPEWIDSTKDMIDTFGKSPETASALLEYLTVLPEESASNGRIDPTASRFRCTGQSF